MLMGFRGCVSRFQGSGCLSGFSPTDSSRWMLGVQGLTGMHDRSTQSAHDGEKKPPIV